MDARHPSASNSSCTNCEYKSRRHKRGRRSNLAIIRRSLPRHCRRLPGTVPGESGTEVPEIESSSVDMFNDNSNPCKDNYGRIHKLFKDKITIFVLNIRSLRAHKAELESHLEALHPHLVLLQETWLDKSHEEIQLMNYVLVSRRDRSDTDNRGGIVTYRRSDFNRVAHISNSESEERSWHFLNLEPEIILLGNWYRPGASPHDGYAALESELAEFAGQYTGLILSGDLNIHHARWLRHSNGNTVQGADLKNLCDSFGMVQCVSDPTRGQYLLDLFLTDLSGCKVSVGPSVADHKFLLGSVPVPEVVHKEITRNAFDFRKAQWKRLRSALRETDWTSLDRGTAEDAFNYFMQALWAQICTFIPFRQIAFTKKSHPWLNHRCQDAIRAKNASEPDPDEFKKHSAVCSRVLAEEYQKHVAVLKGKIASLPKGSKAWWRLNRELLDKKGKLSSIPPLRRDL